MFGSKLYSTGVISSVNVLKTVTRGDPNAELIIITSSDSSTPVVVVVTDGIDVVVRSSTAGHSYSGHGQPCGQPDSHGHDSI